MISTVRRPSRFRRLTSGDARSAAALWLARARSPLPSRIAALMCGTCTTTSTGSYMAKTSPQGHFMNWLHGFPGS
jgi:hypothetical protein